MEYNSIPPVVTVLKLIILALHKTIEMRPVLVSILLF